ncbi:UDP-forming cellulose synthase catalytic subunit [uncultured Paraglaciecola sp.]|uniref:UDP-forming cellulose synthase catalytic subunit n=1 Tax=uncultured Paraglaciecola sp. TaxID=1765024 RepID=UPI002598C876|nr:UDP-forming cellulose synthase catalytic subunit [uncultured Paraglaciecola sp.]
MSERTNANFLTQNKISFSIILSFACLAILLAAPMDSSAQLLSACVFLVGMAFSTRETTFYHKYRHLFRMFTLIIGIALTLRYLIWRSTNTLTAPDLLSLIAVWALFLAEIYAAITHILGCLVNAFPLIRPELDLSEFDEEQLPSVDIMVPSYNESEDILEITLRSALMLHYPKHKLNIHLLDDGGTLQKRNQSDEIKAQEAKDRFADLNKLCMRLGVQYHTREKNEFAKAGNVNSAIENTNGDLIVILDADHVPTADFLDRTVPWMIKNEKVFLVQTPHFMANPDPVERNYFSAFTRMPSENDMFYGTIQKGLDYWSSSFFCGSAAVLRRTHLDLVGGISGDSITEDAETAFDLHKLGYESVYVDRPMVSGLAPETFDGFIVQRMRWAQGMTQILLLKKPFLESRLSWYQRAGYMSSILFWLFPFSRVVFMLMPLAYLLLDLQVYHASLIEILAFAVPHVIATYMISTLLFGRTRWPLVSELYEMLQCTFTLKAIIKVFIKPREPSFVVTPKGESLDKTFISPLSNVFYWLTALLAIANVAGLYRLINEPLTRDLTVVVLLWNSFNLIMMFGLLSVLIEKKQIRSHSRLPAHDRVSLLDSLGNSIEGHLLDLSVGGAKIQLAVTPKVKVSDTPQLVGWSESAQEKVILPCDVKQVDVEKKQVRLVFTPESDQQMNEVIGYSLGDSNRWKSFQRRRTREIPYWYGVKHVLKVSMKPFFTHVYLGLKQLNKK